MLIIGYANYPYSEQQSRIGRNHAKSAVSETIFSGEQDFAPFASLYSYEAIPDALEQIVAGNVRLEYPVVCIGEVPSGFYSTCLTVGREHV